tara:strand:- start:1005 stop:1844 length:840 start_codon:yes stop_codon:yes gene_type:complete
MYDSKFLTKEEIQKYETYNKKGHIGLVSFHRSGNTLTRLYIEYITGHITGSTNHVDVSLVKQLKDAGFQGEGIIDERVQVIKTHSVYHRKTKRIGIGKAILVVRNPYDAINSLYHMKNTSTHTKSTENFKNDKYFDNFIKRNGKKWKKFHKLWLKIQIPIFVIHYENLIHPTKKKECLRNLFSWISHDENEKQMYLEKLNNLFDSNKQLTLYKPRKATVLEGYNVCNTSQKEYITRQCGEFMSKLGYNLENMSVNDIPDKLIEMKNRNVNRVYYIDFKL